MRHDTRAMYLLVALVLTGFNHATGADWPNFRGPNFDGISDETGFKKAWSTPPKVIWEREVGSAFSSFAYVNDRLYTCGTKENQQVLYCLDAKSGAVIWETPFEKAYRNQHGDGTRATPTVHAGRVYVLGAHGRLICADAGTGKIVWEKQFDHKPTWAYSGSVLIEGELAVVSPGDEHGSLVAYNKESGEQVWKTGSDLVGYATPYPFSFNDKRYIVAFMGDAALIVESKTGREVWRTAWKTDWDINAAMPIFHDGYLFLTSGYNTGAGLFKLRSKSDGTLSADKVWQSKVLLNKFQSCILHQGKLYASDQKGLKCVDFMTGKQEWKVPRIKHGSLILADGHLLLLTENGELQIAPLSSGGFSPLTNVDVLDGRCWAVSVLHDGRLYARNLDRIVCLDLKG
ncbi:MAG: PQQ-like beta-propeller repeat protein [Planctomycetes bacterium]|nr:PQQ-like beta-propeller repeat protein [Planctomycetota bacterium]